METTPISQTPEDLLVTAVREKIGKFNGRSIFKYASAATISVALFIIGFMVLWKVKTFGFSLGIHASLAGVAIFLWRLLDHSNDNLFKKFQQFIPNP